MYIHRYSFLQDILKLLHNGNEIIKTIRIESLTTSNKHRKAALS